MSKSEQEGINDVVGAQPQDIQQNSQEMNDQDQIQQQDKKGIDNEVGAQPQDEVEDQQQDIQQNGQEQDKREESILQKIQSFASSLLSAAKDWGKSASSLLSAAKDWGKSALSWSKKPKKIDAPIHAPESKQVEAKKQVIDAPEVKQEAKGINFEKINLDGVKIAHGSEGPNKDEQSFEQKIIQQRENQQDQPNGISFKR